MPTEWDGQPGSKGDPLERVYTPDLLALAHIIHLDARRGGVPPEVVIDTGTGGGAYQRAIKAVWPDAVIIAVDVDPDADFDLCSRQVLEDWVGFMVAELYSGRTIKGDDIQVAGNPPFSKAPKWISLAKRLGYSVSYLMPAGLETRSKATGWPQVFAKTGATQTVIDKRPWKTSRECSVFDFDTLSPETGVFTPVDRITPPDGRWGLARRHAAAA